MLQRLGPWFAAIVLTVACSQSDPGITTAVKSKLVADATVKAYQIDVDTSKRVVTLTGTVETSAAKDKAIMLARETDGVRDVIDYINVNPAVATITDNLRDDAREAAEEAKELGREAQATARETANRTRAALTDAAVTAAVKTTFLADTEVSGLKIDVDTDGGIVTLNGTVATKAEVDRSVSLARGANGVKGVVNNLRIGR